MAMDRATLDQMKENGRERIQERIKQAPMEQLDVLDNLKESIDMMLVKEEEQLAVQKSIHRWVKFFGIITIIELASGVLAAILSLVGIF